MLFGTLRLQLRKVTRFERITRVGNRNLKNEDMKCEIKEPINSKINEIKEDTHSHMEQQGEAIMDPQIQEEKLINGSQTRY